MRRTAYPLIYNDGPIKHLARDYQHQLGATMDAELMPVDVLAFVDRVRRGGKLYFSKGATPYRPDAADLVQWQELTQDAAGLANVLRYGSYRLVNHLELSYYKIMFSLFWDESSPHYDSLLMRGPLLLLAKELGYLEARVQDYGEVTRRRRWQQRWCDEHHRAPFIPESRAQYISKSLPHNSAASGLLAMGDHSLDTGLTITHRPPALLRINKKLLIEPDGYYDYVHVRAEELSGTLGSDYLRPLHDIADIDKDVELEL